MSNHYQLDDHPNLPTSYQPATGRILPEGLYIAQLDNALHFENNQRNIEANWHGFWTETFVSVRDSTTHSIRGLVLHPQYPLIQWGLARDQSTRLLLRDVPNETAAPPQASNDLRTVSSLVPADRLAKYHKRWKSTPSVAARVRLKRAATDEQGSSTNPISLPPCPPSPLDSPLADSSTRAEASSGRPPINAETLRARRGLDASFYLDYALYRIHDSIPGRQTYQIYGHRSKDRDLSISMIMELKAIPSRSGYGEKLDDLFRSALSFELEKAYKDVHLKVPVIFQLHPQQQSVIALAASGLWWSFSLIQKSDVMVEWSKPYTAGQEQDDALLRRLYAAAEGNPGNPGAHDEGWIGKYLHEHRRTKYDQRDCIVTSPPL